MMIINGNYRSCSVHAWRGSLHGRRLLPQHRWVSLGFLPSAHFYRFARSRNRCAAGMTGCAQSKHSGSTIAMSHLFRKDLCKVSLVINYDLPVALLESTIGLQIRAVWGWEIWDWQWGKHGELPPSDWSKRPIWSKGCCHQFRDKQRCEDHDACQQARNAHPGTSRRKEWYDYLNVLILMLVQECSSLRMIGTYWDIHGHSIIFELPESTSHSCFNLSVFLLFLTLSLLSRGTCFGTFVLG